VGGRAWRRKKEKRFRLRGRGSGGGGGGGVWAREVFVPIQSVQSRRSDLLGGLG
jgi:hypothetical protein